MVSGPVARLRLVEAAERLFAERGAHAVSLREIAIEAGQRNTHAVQYHFGSKQALVDAVFEHRMGAINARRNALLDAFEAEGRGDDPYALTEAFVMPLGEVLGEPGRPSWYLRFCVRAVATGDPALPEGPAGSERADLLLSGVRRIHQRTDILLAHLHPAVRADRWTYFTSSCTHALADREQRVDTGPHEPLTPTDLFLAGLVDAAVAVLTAPARVTTTALAPWPPTPEESA
ncbi:TetR/AcrR family transcriptional regulator [Streptodolium elevatio]